MEQSTAFDRAMAVLDLPDTNSTNPCTMQSINPLLGHTGTHIVQSCRHAEAGFTVFIQIVDAGSQQVVQVVLPDKVCRAIYRQRQSLIDRGRKRRPATPDERRRERVKQAKVLLAKERERKRQNGV